MKFQPAAATINHKKSQGSKYSFVSLCYLCLKMGVNLWRRFLVEAKGSLTSSFFSEYNCHLLHFWTVASVRLL